DVDLVVARIGVRAANLPFVRACGCLGKIIRAGCRCGGMREGSTAKVRGGSDITDQGAAAGASSREKQSFPIHHVEDAAGPTVVERLDRGIHGKGSVGGRQHDALVSEGSAAAQ